MVMLAIAPEISLVTGFWLGCFWIFYLIIICKQHRFKLPVLLIISLFLLAISKGIKVLHTTPLRLIIADMPRVSIHC